MRIIPLLIIVLSSVSFGQKSPYEDDIRTLAAASKVENNNYANLHAGFRIHLPQPPCDPIVTMGAFRGPGSAALLRCAHKVTGWKGMYTFDIFADTWAKYPTLTTIEQYVRGLRSLAEHDPKHPTELDPDIKIIQPETSRKWVGLDFEEMIVSHHIPEGTYYQGVSCARIKAYALCFSAEAPTVELVRALLVLDGKLEIISAQKM